MKRCLSRGEYVSARFSSDDVIEIFNRRNEIVCRLFRENKSDRLFRGLACLIVMSLDDGFCNVVSSKPVNKFFSYECKNEWASMESVKRNWPKFENKSNTIQIVNCLKKTLAENYKLKI